MDMAYPPDAPWASCVVQRQHQVDQLPGTSGDAFPRQDLQPRELQHTAAAFFQSAEDVPLVCSCVNLSGICGGASIMGKNLDVKDRLTPRSPPSISQCDSLECLMIRTEESCERVACRPLYLAAPGCQLRGGLLKDNLRQTA